MSCIYFHVKDGEPFRLTGRERAYAGIFTNDLAIAVTRTLGFTGYQGLGERVLRPGHSLAHHIGKREFDQNWALYLHVEHPDIAVAPGRYVDAWHLNLNTAFRVGGDAVKLLARLHAQCEVHCFIKGKNRQFIADTISQGVSDGILREPFTALASWLESADADVVCSYSVCEQFPRWVHDPNDEDNGHPGDWDQQFAALDSLLELNPEHWEYGYHFGTGETWFSVAEYAQTLAATPSKGTRQP